MDGHLILGKQTKLPTNPASRQTILYKTQPGTPVEIRMFSFSHLLHVFKQHLLFLSIYSVLHAILNDAEFVKMKNHGLPNFCFTD